MLVSNMGMSAKGLNHHPPLNFCVAKTMNGGIYYTDGGKTTGSSLRTAPSVIEPPAAAEAKHCAMAPLALKLHWESCRTDAVLGLEECLCTQQVFSIQNLLIFLFLF